MTSGFYSIINEGPIELNEVLILTCIYGSDSQKTEAASAGTAIYGLEDAPELPAELTTIMPLEKQSQLHNINAVFPSISLYVRL
jgi:hypothetical protein